MQTINLLTDNSDNTGGECYTKYIRTVCDGSNVQWRLVIMVLIWPTALFYCNLKQSECLSTYGKQISRGMRSKLFPLIHMCCVNKQYGHHCYKSNLLNYNVERIGISHGILTLKLPAPFEHDLTPYY